MYLVDKPARLIIRFVIGWSICFSICLARCVLPTEKWWHCFVLWPQSLMLPSFWQLFYLWRKIACLPWVFTSDWCRQICSTLNAAHKKNIECWICPTFQILWLTRKIYVPPWNLHCLLLRNVKPCFPWVITFHTNPKDAYWRKTISPLLTAHSQHVHVNSVHYRLSP